MSIRDHTLADASSEIQAVEISGSWGRDEATVGASLERLALDHLRSIRVFGGLPLHLPELSCEERGSRIVALLNLWSSGCRRAVDERLYADLLNRHRHKKEEASTNA